jgi:hypothetical protein
MIELTESISLIEVIYFLGGVAGLMYALRWLSMAESDRRSLDPSDGGRIHAATINVVIGRVMTAKLTVYSIAGALAMTLPPAGSDVTWQSTVIGLAVVSGEILAVWLLRYINARYDEMVRYFEAHQQEAHHLRKPAQCHLARRSIRAAITNPYRAWACPIRMTRNDLPRLTAQRRTDIAAAFTKASATMVSTARLAAPCGRATSSPRSKNRCQRRHRRTLLGS